MSPIYSRTSNWWHAVTFTEPMIRCWISVEQERFHLHACMRCLYTLISPLTCIYTGLMFLSKPKTLMVTIPRTYIICSLTWQPLNMHSSISIWNQHKLISIWWNLSYARRSTYLIWELSEKWRGRGWISISCASKLISWNICR